MNDKKILTLCIVERSPYVLLGMKKRGFGTGMWNGFGGKVQEGETVEDATRREVLEETGLGVNALEKAGLIDFEFQDGSAPREVHIFLCKNYRGELQESEEMRPEWFSKDALPFGAMWPADAYWLPALLEGKRFRGRFLYDHPSSLDYQSVILERMLEEVEEI